jgi:UPF0176 protein
MQLYNKLSNEERATLIKKANEKRLTLSFYKYHRIKNVEVFRNYLFTNFNNLSILGRIYVSSEGINSQLSIPSKKMGELKSFLDSIYFLKDIRLNVGIEHHNESFLKLKIKIKDKIVADGLKAKDYDMNNSGTHVNAKDFNELLEKPETITIDMRNHYESEVGHFKGAVCPDVDTFRDSLPLIYKKFKHAKENNILMYCTGGIRCEKASSYLKKNGFKNVFQLSGGIIEYARQIKEVGIENKFVGKNFVFDNRLGERISNEIIAKCHVCGEECDRHVNCNNEACHVLFIQCEKCYKELDGCCSNSCKDIYALPVDKQKKIRKGYKNRTRFFKKGRLSERV